ncbi:MAG: thioredoxin [Myxococcales bacterium]|nr:MAG: thioredoxin [Myxococcales bacterium]
MKSLAVLLPGAACLALGVVACSGQRGSTSAPTPAEASVEVAAEIDGDAITVAELDDRIKEELFRSRAGDPSKLYGLRSDALDELIRERLLEIEGKRRGVPADAVVELELEAMGPVTEEEIVTFYEENFAKQGDRTLDEIREQIERYLNSRRAAEVPNRLRERAKIEVLLTAPRYDVVAEGPSKGPAGARVTIVEFSDFQCPYCQRVLATMDEVLAKYPEDVRLVYRHLPLDRIHPNARGAAEAAACADEQGQFWSYHDTLFQNNRALGKEDLVRYATDAGLDATRFQACFDERRFKDKVEADLQAARAVGISGTPAFVVNGIMLSGAQPAEAFYKVIDQELARPAESDDAGSAPTAGPS